MKSKNIKRFTALFLAASVLASCHADDKDGMISDNPDTTDSTAVQETPAAPLSNPVAVDENGDVDI